MSNLEKGQKAPDFSSLTDMGEALSLSDLKGQKTVLYFYPKDDTPGCTKQACGFTQNMPHFEELGVRVIGVSKDTPEKHQKFKKKYDLNFTLLSDTEGSLCDTYGVWKEKSMYGKTFLGIERTTFLIDEDLNILEIWRKVSVKDHIEDVKATLAEHTKAAA